MHFRNYSFEKFVRSVGDRNRHVVRGVPFSRAGCVVLTSFSFYCFGPETRQTGVVGGDECYAVTHRTIIIIFNKQHTHTNAVYSDGARKLRTRRYVSY